jgi:transposase
MSFMDDTRPLDIEDAPTTDHRSQRIEVITRGERRRVWELEQKREIVLASLEPGARPSDVARFHDISTGQLYTWRRQMMGGQLGNVPRPIPSFARVEIAATPTEANQVGVASSDAESKILAGPDRFPAAPRSETGGQIEIVLPDGVYVLVESPVVAGTTHPRSVAGRRKIAPALVKVFRGRTRPVGKSWRMDETFIKSAANERIGRPGCADSGNPNPSKESPPPLGRPSRCHRPSRIQARWETPRHPSGVDADH